MQFHQPSITSTVLDPNMYVLNYTYINTFVLLVLSVKYKRLSYHGI
jgi:hypothetical protein